MAETDGDSAGSRPVNKLQAALAVGLVVIFIGMLVGMAALRGDKNWDRLVYLLSGFEAIVFAGVGAIFGTTAQRASTTSARADAEQARADALIAREHSEAGKRDAIAGRILSAAVIAKAESRGVTPSTRRGARPEDVDNSFDDLAELAQLAQLTFPS